MTTENEEIFCLKDDNYSKLWVEVIIVTLLDAVATADVLKADNNDVELVETRSVHFARLKSSSRSDRLNKPRLLVLQNFITCLSPEVDHVTLPLFPSLILKRYKDGGYRAVNKVYYLVCILP